MVSASACHRKVPRIESEWWQPWTKVDYWDRWKTGKLCWWRVVNPERALSTDACKNEWFLTSQVEQKSKRKKESLTQSQQLGVGHTTCKARQLWSIRSQARQHTAMSHDREKATSRLHKKNLRWLVHSFCNYGDWELSRQSELKQKMRRVNKSQFRRPLKPGQRMAQWLAHRPVTKWTQVRIWVVAALDESWLWGPKKDRKAILMTSITQKERSL